MKHVWMVPTVAPQPPHAPSRGLHPRDQQPSTVPPLCPLVHICLWAACPQRRVTLHRAAPSHAGRTEEHGPGARPARWPRRGASELPAAAHAAGCSRQERWGGENSSNTGKRSHAKEGVGGGERKQEEGKIKDEKEEQN